MELFTILIGLALCCWMVLTSLCVILIDGRRLEKFVDTNLLVICVKIILVTFIVLVSPGLDSLFLAMWTLSTLLKSNTRPVKGLSTNMAQSPRMDLTPPVIQSPVNLQLGFYRKFSDKSLFHKIKIISVMFAVLVSRFNSLIFATTFSAMALSAMWAMSTRLKSNTRPVKGLSTNMDLTPPAVQSPGVIPTVNSGEGEGEATQQREDYGIENNEQSKWRPAKNASVAQSPRLDLTPVAVQCPEVIPIVNSGEGDGEATQQKEDYYSSENKWQTKEIGAFDDWGIIQDVEPHTGV